MIKCHECGAKISEHAPSCPKCGVPATRQPPPQPARSRPWGTIAIVSIVGVVAVVALSDPNSSSFAPSPRNDPTQAPKPWAPSKDDVVKQPDRKKLMQTFGALWSKYEGCNTIDLCLYVKPGFYGLDVDHKQTLAQLFWTWHAVNAKSDVVAVRLMDSRSGKAVGSYERGKLNML